MGWYFLYPRSKLNLLCRRRAFPTDGYSEEELNSDTLQLYLSHCTWAQFQAPHLQACTGHVLLQVLTRLWVFCHTAFPREVTKPGGENSVLWTGPQWGRWVAQVEFHVWVDKIGLCAGLWNSLSSFSSSHRKGSPEDTVLLCANGRWCKYSLCASPWHSVIGHLKPYKGPGMQCVTQTLHEGGEDSWRKVLQHNDKSRNELRGITEGQIMNWKSFRNSSKHRSFVLFSSVPHHRKEAWLSNVSPGETGIECYF